MRRDILLVTETRGRVAENLHFGALALCGPVGQNIFLGDVYRPIPPRCVLKPVQALPLLVTGAADRLGLSGEEIAMACASHLALPFQKAVLRRWLCRLELEEEALLCPPEPSRDRYVASAAAQRGELPTRLDNNSAGRHLAVISTASDAGEDLSKYLDPTHPAQRRIAEAVAQVFGGAFVPWPDGVDNCGMPYFPLSLAVLAEGMRRLGTGALPVSLVEPARRILVSMASHPDLIVGPGRATSLSIRQTNGRLIVKGGSDGIYAGVHRERGIGFAFKITSGSQLAADEVLRRVVAAMGDDATLDDANARIRERHSPTGLAIGQIRWEGPDLKRLLHGLHPTAVGA